MACGRPKVAELAEKGVGDETRVHLRKVGVARKGEVRGREEEMSMAAETQLRLKREKRRKTRGFLPYLIRGLRVESQPSDAVAVDKVESPNRVTKLQREGRKHIEPSLHVV